MSKAIVVCSGGQDSTTCLLWALKLYDEVETMTFSYNQRHKQEIEVAKKISKDCGVKKQVIDA
ncbi:7-cyano-7-deazaguanine synthase QueC, partial [Staphylococcus pseudintermedius]|uniref:7-cyano-7-deazaguanine synthase n=1 Tax=Staphylococcus pseudintermedius TaxID=283734 RepID=UPI000E3B4060